jgi:hypothetical protein
MASRTPLGVQLTQAQFELREADARARAAEDELARFKALVRTVALDVKQSEGWCKPGFNEVMGTLGLEKLPDYFEVKLTVVATQEVTIQLDADELTDAGNTLDEEGVHLFVGELSNVTDYVLDSAIDYEWRYTDVTVGSVTAHS